MCVCLRLCVGVRVCASVCGCAHVYACTLFGDVPALPGVRIGRCTNVYILLVLVNAGADIYE